MGEGVTSRRVGRVRCVDVATRQRSNIRKHPPETCRAEKQQ
jgi:hypothetical protein